MVNIRLIAVPVRVYSMVLPYPLHISDFASIILYPSRVRPRGIIHTFPPATRLGLLKEAINMKYNGYRQINRKNRAKMESTIIKNFILPAFPFHEKPPYLLPDTCITQFFRKSIYGKHQNQIYDGVE